MRLAALLMMPAYRGIEAAAGPFYEPDRPRPALGLEDAKRRAMVLEVLLERLARARVRTLAIPAAFAVIGAGLALYFLYLGASVWVSLGALVWAVFMGMFAYFRYWSGWSPAVFTGAVPVTPWQSTAGHVGLLGASRDFYDAVVSLDEWERVGFLRSLTAIGCPLVAAAVRHSWSLVPSHDRHEAA